MPDAAPPDPVTTDYLTANVRQQVVAQLATASLPAAATAGRVFADTTLGRLVFDSGSALVPGPAWASGGRVGWSLTDSTNRSIPTGTTTYTSLTFATKTTDTDGFFSAPGTTVTIPTGLGGIYDMNVTITWASSPGANSVLMILVNGAVGYRFPIGAATQSTVFTASLAGLALAAGDTIVVQPSQGSGASINVNPARWQGWRRSA